MESLLKSIEELRRTLVKRNFKQAIELILKLKDIDVKKPENRISEQIELPNAINKPVKVCVIASGDLAIRAGRSGADIVIGREELEKLGKDKKAARKLAEEYDHFIAEATLMPVVGKTVGPMLGPRNKMPTPVPPSAPIGEIIERHKRTVRIRIKDQPIIQCRVATEDMPDEKIAENIQAVVARVESKLERGLKNIDSIMLKTAMGPIVKAYPPKAD
jgi:large subunit ribosomal protein L1